MKKYAFVLLAGSIIGLSACGSDSNNDTTQQQIDSAANARAAELEAAHQAQTDSILNEMARMKADSVAMADSLARASNTSSTTTTRTTTTTKTTKPSKPVTPSTPPPTTQQQEQKDKFDSRQNGSNTISEQKKDEQKSKFDRRKGGSN